MKKNNEPLIVTRQLKASIKSVWNAITQHNQMKQWFFEQIENFEPVVGFETSFLVKSGERIFPHLWKIIEVIEESKIVYSWKYEGYAGDSFVTFYLVENNSGTNITITTEIIKDFTDSIPEFQPESCIAGWKYFLERLNAYLNENFKK